MSFLRDLLNDPRMPVNNIEMIDIYINKGETVEEKIDRIKNMLADQINSHGHRELKINHLLERLTVELNNKNNGK